MLFVLSVSFIWKYSFLYSQSDSWVQSESCVMCVSHEIFFFLVAAKNVRLLNIKIAMVVQSPLLISLIIINSNSRLGFSIFFFSKVKTNMPMARTRRQISPLFKYIEEPLLEWLKYRESAGWSWSDSWGWWLLGWGFARENDISARYLFIVEEHAEYY